MTAIGYATGPGKLRQELRDDRAMAEEIPCAYCGAEIGQTCVNTRSGERLGRMPAHPVRLREANVV